MFLYNTVTTFSVALFMHNTVPNKKLDALSMYNTNKKFDDLSKYNTVKKIEALSKYNTVINLL